MNKTGLEYLDYTWNPLAMLCTPVSEGCAHCWHISMANRLSGVSAIHEEARKAYAGGEPYLYEDRLNDPSKLRKPSIIGVQFMGDLFKEDVPFEFIDKVWDIINIYRQHTFIILTKRPERVMEYVKRIEVFRFHSNIWLGVSISNQKDADAWIPTLLETPAAVRFVSIEPMLGLVNLRNIDCGVGRKFNAIQNKGENPTHWERSGNKLNWVIVGGESGPGARTIDINHAREVKNHCVAADTPFFFKQWNIDGKIVKMPTLDGQVWDQMPDTKEAKP